MSSTFHKAQHGANANQQVFESRLLSNFSSPVCGLLPKKDDTPWPSGKLT